MRQRIFRWFVLLVMASIMSTAATMAENPFKMLRDRHKASFQFGYTNKQMISDHGVGGVVHESILGKNNGFTHGAQVGLNLYLLRRNGMGIHTGAFFNAFLATANEGDATLRGYKRFMETEAYVPAHLMYRFSLVRRFSLSVYAGVGLNYGIFGSFTNKDEMPWKNRNEVMKYDKPGWPNRFGMQTELGASLRMGTMELNVLYGIGITDHKYYAVNKTRQNRITIGVAKPF